MRLEAVLSGLLFRADRPLAGIEVNRIVDDSRSVIPGDMFVAVRGSSLNGESFIREALDRGAAIVVAEEHFSAPRTVVRILAEDTYKALPVMAGNFYDHPSRRLKMTGITGTNGKTTITYIMENILKASGKVAGIIGTINYRINNMVAPARNTTPGTLELHRLLSDMVRSGLEHAVMEVSSHSLAQNRVDGVSFDAGIFTNVTSDHLDYHKTPADYFKAKARLFGKIKDGGTAILNNDDAKVASLARSIRGKVITYGINNNADVRAADMKLTIGGSSFTANTPYGKLPINTVLIGMHNVSNILACIAASYALGIPHDAVTGGIRATVSVPGRLERVDAGQAFKVFVDYAHTEDALYNVLGMLRSIAKRRIITVFGCGGNRDRTKRPLMGNVVCSYSDMAVVTSDNPRSEEPAGIISEIEDGIRGKYSNYVVIADRRAAIGKALEMAASGDIVLIAGKGHEDYQIIGKRVLPFDDRKVALGILKNISRKDRVAAAGRQ